MYSLIFFIARLPVACRHAEEKGIMIRWDGKRATGITIPIVIAQSVPVDSLAQWLSVRLADQKVNMVGEFRLLNNDIIFEPLIPLTRGLRYTIWLRNQQLGAITVPALASDDAPSLLAIYPSQDSLPDNLLKMYLHFSRPMREGQSLKYVTLLKNKTDTLANVFLNLQPELWNADRTVLTLWLDPGRIKRDLQPNKQLGAPLQSGASYELIISGNWPDEQGAILTKSTSKTFVTIQRDSLSPAPKRWTIHAPKAKSNQPVELLFGEPLDYGLLAETLHILQPNGKALPGTWQISNEEKQVRFNPISSWQPGQYTLRIEARLEDLAGNNINRLFDRDITRKEQRNTAQSYTDLTFTVGSH